MGGELLGGHGRELLGGAGGELLGRRGRGTVRGCRRVQNVVGDGTKDYELQRNVYMHIDI